MSQNSIELNGNNEAQRVNFVSLEQAAAFAVRNSEKPYEACDDETSVAIATELEEAYLENGNAGLLKQAAAIMNGLYEIDSAPYRISAENVATTQPERCRDNKYKDKIIKLSFDLHEIDAEIFEYLKRYISNPNEFDAVCSLMDKYCETARELGRAGILA